VGKPLCGGGIVQHEAVDHLRSAFGKIPMVRPENCPFRALTAGVPERYDPFLSGMGELLRRLIPGRNKSYR
jgi:hypothetical protein